MLLLAVLFQIQEGEGVPSADLGHHAARRGEVALGIDLRNIGPGVPQDRLGGLQPVPRPDRGRGRMAELIRRPGRHARLLAGPQDRVPVAVPTIAARMVDARKGRPPGPLRRGRPGLPAGRPPGVVLRDGLTRVEQIGLRVGPDEFDDEPPGLRPRTISRALPRQAVLCEAGR